MSENFIFFISFSFFILSIVAYQKTNSSKTAKSLFLFVILSLIFSYIVYYAINYFYKRNVDEVIYKLAWAGFSEYKLLVLAIITLAILGTTILLNLTFKKKPEKYSTQNRIFCLFIFLSFLFNPIYIGLVNFCLDFKINQYLSISSVIINDSDKHSEIPFTALRVAHAGGGINKKTYTNSIEALDYNIRKGFRYFEIDFSFTKDSRLVCLHDWKDSFQRSFGFEVNERINLKEFNYLVTKKSEFQKCTIRSLFQWMKKNPSAYIVTDIKNNNIKGLHIIMKQLPKAQSRVIPQVYYPQNLALVKSLGFEKIIWTLYRFKGSNDEVLAWVKKIKHPIAITMSMTRAETNLPKELKRKKIPTYVHTINDYQKAEKYIKKFEITEIYTDFLAP